MWVFSTSNVIRQLFSFRAVAVDTGHGCVMISVDCNLATLFILAYDSTDFFLSYIFLIIFCLLLQYITYLVLSFSILSMTRPSYCGPRLRILCDFPCRAPNGTMGLIFTLYALLKWMLAIVRWQSVVSIMCYTILTLGRWSKVFCNVMDVAFLFSAASVRKWIARSSPHMGRLNMRRISPRLCKASTGSSYLNLNRPLSSYIYRSITCIFVARFDYSELSWDCKLSLHWHMWGILACCRNGELFCQSIFASPGS